MLILLFNNGFNIQYPNNLTVVRVKHSNRTVNSFGIEFSSTLFSFSVVLCCSDAPVWDLAIFQF